MMPRRFLLLLLLVLAPCIPCPAARADDIATQKFSAAVQRLLDAERINTKDPAAARVAFVEAADAFEHLATSDVLWPRDRAVAWFRAGRAADLAGDVPRAVLALRRAELIDPALPALAPQLHALRERVAKAAAGASPASPTPPPAPPNVSDTLRALANSIPTSLYLPAATAFALVAGVTGGWSLVTPIPRLRWLSLASLSAALLVMSAWTYGRWPVLTRADAIVRVHGAVPRNRPGYEATAVPGVSLVPGQELRLLDSRTVTGATWVHVSLASPGLTPPFWLPADSAVPVAVER